MRGIGEDLLPIRRVWSHFGPLGLELIAPERQLLLEAVDIAPLVPQRLRQLRNLNVAGGGDGPHAPYLRLERQNLFEKQRGLAMLFAMLCQPLL